jgi:hypothetical protein
VGYSSSVTGAQSIILLQRCQVGEVSLNGNNEDVSLRDAAPADMKKTAGESRSLKPSVEALGCPRAVGKLAVANISYTANLFAAGHN